MHSVFLYHAIKAGMDMGIVNAGQMAVYDDLNAELREACEDVVLNRRADAAERLLALAERYRGQGKEKKEADLRWRERPVGERLSHARVHGITDFIDTDVEEARLALYQRLGELLGNRLDLRHPARVAGNTDLLEGGGKGRCWPFRRWPTIVAPN